MSDVGDKRAAESHDEAPSPKKAKKPIRIWCDGCFDMMHYGHANALRQAKTHGDYLIVGVHSDEEIAKNKGPPVMHEDERYAAVRACKWVDEVVEAAPYVTDVDILKKHNVDWCIHGDDIITTADGEDTYGKVKAAGLFKTVPRTRGVSTTDLVGRMLLLTKTHHRGDDEDVENAQEMSEGPQPKQSPYTRLSKFVPTTRQLMQFSVAPEPKPDDKIVYIDGTFDLFHVGHIKILEKAKAEGDYLIVGVHPDKVANRIKGSNHPIMNLHERVLSVLSCRYVNEVVIGAPYKVTATFIEQQRIAVVLHGSDVTPPPCDDGSDPYEVPKQQGIYKTLESPSSLTTMDVIERIFENRKAYEERNRKKQLKEIAEAQQ
eukprot:TRINITY_DN4858_c0_g1_i1.p1 TRINITY_DN4858_c0_g1~~TRINITY_DN4858_c0_g1_i1.p1  ORF type:complete len:374 (+),score=124.07 TRINITY_DN4858_c0_g1_i1:51-1172(+)